MAISKGYLDLLVSYLQMASGKSPMAVIGKQSVRCSFQDVNLCMQHSSRLMRWIRSKIPGVNNSRLERAELLRMFDISHSVDFDLYRKPDVRLDLSHPIPAEYRNRFLSLLEIGTLEHIINPYQALVNFDDMVRVGGIVIHLSPIKIRPNHGYYCISPQLLFDFYLSNGRYELIRSDLASYYLGYDSLISPILITSYGIEHDLANYRELGVGRVLARKLRRFSVFLSAGTIIGFVVRKTNAARRSNTLVQKQYRDVGTPGEFG